MKKKLLLFAIGFTAVLMLLEIVFRLLPVSTATRSGYYIHPHILTYPPYHCFTAATGWDLRNSQHNCTNNLGFLADRDFVYEPQAIVLIGDSYVEANMLPAKERLAVQMEQKLAGRPVYSMGGPGSNLLDYAERAKFAAENLGTKTFVFLIERGDLWQSLCGSGNIHAHCLDPQSLLPKSKTTPPPSALKRLMRESALAQYVYSQLKFDLSKVLSNLNPQRPSPAPKQKNRLSSSVRSQIINRFFEQISAIEGARFIFLIDADRARLSETPSSDDEFTEFRHSAKTGNAFIIDPTDEFRAFVNASGRNLEVGPYDHHWNRSAIRIIANLISQEL